MLLLLVFLKNTMSLQKKSCRKLNGNLMKN